MKRRPDEPCLLPRIARWLVAVAVAATVARGRVGPPSAAAILARSPLATTACAAPTGPEAAPARLLRALPGLGERRARTVVDARWAAGGRLPLERWTALDGIGPVTVAGLRARTRRRAPRVGACGRGVWGLGVWGLGAWGFGARARRRVDFRPVSLPRLERPLEPVSPGAPPRAGRPAPPPTCELDRVLIPAFAEDLGLDWAPDGGSAVGEAESESPAGGSEARSEAARGWMPRRALERDLSTAASVGPEVRGVARLRSRAHGVVCGLSAFARAFELLDPDSRCTTLVEDGDRIAPGDELARVEACARALLTAERTALNVVQRLSGTATATAALVDRARSGGEVRILDTRKTTPGLRLLEKYAVRCGGGENHRFGLYDEVMLKDNHLDLARGVEGLDMGALVARVRERVGDGVRLTAEARDRTEAEAALRAGADVLLLDNFGPDQLAELCPRLRDLAASLGATVEFEASGGIDLETAAAYAASGVDRLSVGALTHSAPALDLALELEAAR